MNPFTLTYSVHPSPRKEGQPVTYHVRHEQRHVIRTRELQKYIARHHPISQGTFVMVLETLKEELVRLLLQGQGVHLDGLGRFALQIGMRRQAAGPGEGHDNHYYNPDELHGDEVRIEGVTFVPDKELLSRLTADVSRWQRKREQFRQDVGRDELVTWLTDYCRGCGTFTRRTVEFEFGLSRYKASLLLDRLVAEPQPLFQRHKEGPAWVYDLRA